MVSDKIRWHSNSPTSRERTSHVPYHSLCWHQSLWHSGRKRSDMQRLDSDRLHLRRTRATPTYVMQHLRCLNVLKTMSRNRLDSRIRLHSGHCVRWKLGISWTLSWRCDFWALAPLRDWEHGFKSRSLSAVLPCLYNPCYLGCTWLSWCISHAIETMCWTLVEHQMRSAPIFDIMLVHNPS